DEQIAAAVQAALKAQTTGSPTGNGARQPPAPPALEPTSDTDPSWCPIHRVKMERRTNERGSWYSHRLDAAAPLGPAACACRSARWRGAGRVFRVLRGREP